MRPGTNVSKDERMAAFDPLRSLAGGVTMLAMRHALGLALLGMAGCTQPVEVSAIKSSTDYTGLTEHERSQFDWAAVEVDVPLEVARSMRRWELGNITLDMFRCKEPEDAYPAHATKSGDLFTYVDIPEPVNEGVTLVFYVPKHVQERERYGCAALDAKGYSPVFLRSQVVRLPTLKFVSFKPKTQRPPASS